MSVMVQIRNMPDALHRKLKARAAEAGMSLSDYLLGEVRRSANAPTIEEMWERLDALPPMHTTETPLQALHASRRERERRLDELISNRPATRKRTGK